MLRLKLYNSGIYKILRNAQQVEFQVTEKLLGGTAIQFSQNKNGDYTHQDEQCLLQSQWYYSTIQLNISVQKIHTRNLAKNCDNTQRHNIY